MEIDVKTSAGTQQPGATDERETQRLSSLVERDIGVAPGLDKIAASLELLRLEMQGIRLVLEALVAKS
jgi:hypothetical protein